ncbi:alpha/beta hydrolase [Mycolicibacterium alvei]|uniref:Putative hydrolase, alpha/beta fold protein n=1 Tax=Mycolicibacterium alvei TaxID=67081 RepID=A0A6N4URS7_9MYCO|nr:alpha/beta hydrolase [Mycolicibacterium alvei]MCV7002143.1 alpha/beta hydrolase [Mycolicibacterium alvei]BBX26241.1 putative hydrolase, alpha/beta fold protein [Mycolicibacterium alvei]
MKRVEIQIPVAGSTITAWHYAADGAQRRPCVVMAHGFCGTRDAGLVGFGERFAEAGIDTVCFDYRGFGASGGRPRQVIEFAAQQHDYHAAINAARRLPRVSGVVIWGTSLSGGHVFAVAAARDDLLAAIALTPIVDGWTTLLRMRRAIPPRVAGRLGATAVRDALGAKLGRPPVLLPAVGPPGSAAMLTTPDALPGYLAATAGAPLWRNEFAARILLAVPTYRPGLLADRIGCPVLVQIAGSDLNAPVDLARAAGARADATVRDYPEAGHFDVYDSGSAFDAVVTAQISFLSSLSERTPR